MGAIEDIARLKASSAVSWAILFLSVIGPGALILYLYEPELVRQIDSVKFVILSGALTAPTMMLLLFTSGVADSVAASQDKVSKGQAGVLQDWYVLHGVHSSCIFYLAIAIAYLWSLSFRQLVYFVAVLTVLGMLFEILRVVTIYGNPSLFDSLRPKE
jgi:hypothetical protein